MIYSSCKFYISIMRMKIKRFLWNRIQSIRYFPISHIVLLIISTILILHINWFFDNIFSYKILISLFIVFLLSTLWPIIDIHSSNKSKTKISLLFQILSIIIWVIYYIIISHIQNIFTYSEWLTYFWIIPISLASIPLTIAIIYSNYPKKTRLSRNILVKSIIFWLISWGIIWWWISWALLSIRELFAVYIDSDRYLYIWVISEILLAWSFIFSFYISEIQEKKLQKSDFEIKPSRLQAIIWKFIFLPLSFIYLTIFLTYWIKILITWVWPNGIIVRLGIWYFLLWIIWLYLTDYQTISFYNIITKILYISFILTASMMMWAIIQRINQYWITINRRFICYIIAFIIIYSALSLFLRRKRLLSFISLITILLLLALYGPLSWKNISYISQKNRLESILSHQNIYLPLWEWSLKNLPQKDTLKISSIIDELITNHNKDKIVGKIISFNYKTPYQYLELKSIKETLWLSVEYENIQPEFYNYRQNEDYSANGIDISWYSKLYKFQEYNNKAWDNTITLNFENKEHSIDLSEFIDHLMEKALLYKKSHYNLDTTSDEMNELKNPALILEKDNYKIIISGFHAERNQETNKLKFSNVEWIILLKN